MGRGRGNSGKSKTLTANPIMLASNLRANHHDKSRRKAFERIYKEDHPSFQSLRYQDKYLYKRLSDRGPSYFDLDKDINAYLDLVFEKVNEEGEVTEKHRSLFFTTADYIRFRNFDDFNDRSKTIEYINKEFSTDDIKERLRGLDRENFDLDAIAEDYRKFFSDTNFYNNIAEESLQWAKADPNVDKEAVTKSAAEITVEDNLNYLGNHWPEQKRVLKDPSNYTAEEIGVALASFLQYGNATYVPFYYDRPEPDDIKPLKAHRVRDYMDESEDVISDVCRYTRLPKKDIIRSYNILVEKEAEKQMII